MDEQLLKRAVQSIEMPEDMKDRIIENCRSGETKPLFPPKKRFIYMPVAASVCVCLLVAALAGVGIWQMKTLSEGNNETPTGVTNDIVMPVPQEDVIIVIPISDEDLDTMAPVYKSGYSEEQSSYDDFVALTEEKINEYYGIDTGSLLSGLNISLTPIDPAKVDGWTGPYVYRADGGTGEVYFDTNAFKYGKEGEICVYISKFAIPHSIPRLWSDKEQLSTISGITAAVGMREGDGWKRYRVEFERKLEQDTLYFNVWCDYDMISSVVSEIKYKCDSSYAAGVPVDITDAAGDDVYDCMDIINQNSDFTAIDGVVYDIDLDGIDEVLVLADVPFRAICVFEKENGKMVQTDTFGMGSLSYVETLELNTYSDDDEKYPFFIFHYDNGGVMKCDVVAAIKPADGSYTIEYLLSFGTLNYTDIPEPFTKEFYRIGWNKTDIAMDRDYNDISKEEFLELYAKYRVYEPLTLEKLREICSGDCSSLSWKDFQQFESTEIGSGLYILCYSIEDKYTLTIGGGDPHSEPFYMNFHAEGQYYSIDIREESLEEYLNQPIPEGDVINITSLEEDEINYFLDADFVDGEQLWLTDEQLGIYYGIDVTAFGNIPSYMTAESYTHNNGMRCIWKRDGVTGIYYDKNTFSFSDPDRSAFIDISMGTLMNSNEKLWENKKMLSWIGGRDIAIGGTETGHYVAEFRSGDSQVFFVISAFGISTGELHDVIAAMVEQTEERSGDYTYPSQYIDALQAKTDHQDPAEFIFGVERIIKESATVEEMYQALEKFDTEGRIDKILISLDGKPVTEGRLVQGLNFEVYYDNETSWFEFQY